MMHVFMMHVFMMNISMIIDHDACVYDDHMFVACIYDPRPLTLIYKNIYSKGTENIMVSTANFFFE